MNFLAVRNWEKFQHYKDRQPPWIKLHRELLDDYEFSRLQDASKAHLMLIWMLASQLENKIPDDPEWIARKIGSTDKIDIKGLIEKGFLVSEQDASKPLAKCSPEAEAYREEAETEDIPDRAGEAVQIWNEVCGDILPKVKTLSEPRKKKLTQRLKDLNGLEGWRDYVTKIRGSPFLTGENKQGWRADFDFAISAEKMNRVLEGSYKNGTTGRKSTYSERLAAAGQSALDEIVAEIDGRTEGQSGLAGQFGAPELRDIQRLRQAPGSGIEHTQGVYDGTGGLPRLGHSGCVQIVDA